MHLADVDLKVVGLGVRLGAVGTDKGSRSCVNHKVSLKLPCRWKPFATLVTLVIVRLSFVQEALVCVLVKKISQKMEPRKTEPDSFVYNISLIPLLDTRHGHSSLSSPDYVYES